MHQLMKQQACLEMPKSTLAGSPCTWRPRTAHGANTNLAIVQCCEVEGHCVHLGGHILGITPPFSQLSAVVAHCKWKQQMQIEAVVQVAAALAAFWPVGAICQAPRRHDLTLSSALARSLTAFSASTARPCSISAVKHPSQSCLSKYAAYNCMCYHCLTWAA